MCWGLMCTMRKFTNFNHLGFTTFHGLEIGFYRMLSPDAMTMGFSAIKSRKHKRRHRKWEGLTGMPFHCGKLTCLIAMRNKSRACPPRIHGIACELLSILFHINHHHHHHHITTIVFSSRRKNKHHNVGKVLRLGYISESPESRVGACAKCQLPELWLSMIGVDPKICIFVKNCRWFWCR